LQTTKDLYKLLGLPRDASRDDIRKAHRMLVRKHHPDANPQDPQAEERFKEIQQAYEVLSNEQKRREYDQRFHASSRGRADRPRARGAGTRTGGETTSTVDLSDLLGKLADLSSDRVDGRDEGSRTLQGEDIARIAKRLGIDISRLSKVLGENIRVNAKVSFEDAPSGRFSAMDKKVSGWEPSGISNKAHGKRVKGPSARRRRKSD
jgi:DnaJ-class molecular chaperone